MSTSIGAANVVDVAPDDLIDSAAALALLGVKPQTLYAYVSRGLIRAVNRPGSKSSLYYRQDLESLQMRGRTRGAARNVAERSLRLGGSAVLQTTITLISAQGPRYRGVLATDLAHMGRPFEDCAELLWSGVLPVQSVPWVRLQLPDAFGAFASAIGSTAEANNMRRLFTLCIEALASCAGAHAELKAGASVLAARQLIQVMACACGYVRSPAVFEWPNGDEQVARSLCRSLGIEPTAEVEQSINAALIICADHELAPSTFAARIAASAGADVYSCVSSALGAFEGMHTGLGCDMAEDLLHQSDSPEQYVEALRGIAQRKLPLPGYNHALYPDGDPRGAFLLSLLRSAVRSGRRAQPGAERVLACISAAREKLNAVPTLSLGLAAMSVAFDFPLRSAGAIMVLGRSAGWVAHVLEQRLAGFLVRPRAEYVGPPDQMLL